VVGVVEVDVVVVVVELVLGVEVLVVEVVLGVEVVVVVLLVVLAVVEVELDWVDGQSWLASCATVATPLAKLVRTVTLIVSGRWFTWLLSWAAWLDAAPQRWPDTAEASRSSRVCRAED